jgi:hypothetical protein
MEKEKEGCDTCINYPCVLQEWSSDKGRKLLADECGDYEELTNKNK